MALTHNKSITSEELYELFHPYTIFKNYCDNWSLVNYEFNKNFISEPSLRSGDTSPSARITVSSNNNIYYIDYGENVPRTAIDFVKDKFRLTINQTINKIYTELKDTENISTPRLVKNINKTIHRYKHTAKIVKIKSRKWTKQDLKYWKQFGWSLELLTKANITPISKFWVDSKKTICYEPVYCFNYYEHEGIFRRKIYFPFRDSNRFVSNIDNTVVQGWNLLPKEGGEDLVITKAFKDIGSFLSIGVYACATNNETSFFPEKVVKKLKSRWNNIHIWWDNDTEGIKSGIKYANKFKLKFTCNNLLDPKDPSDYYKDCGRENFIKLVKTKI